MKRTMQILSWLGGIDLWMAIAASALAALMIVAASEAQAQTFQVLHAFTGGEDGGFPVAGLTMDRKGNLYGVTAAGGDTQLCVDGGAANGCGAVFKLVHENSGWVASPLYLFQGGTDGQSPSGRVIFGPDGALYGVTSAGGTNNCNAGFGTCGIVFRVAPPPSACKSFVCPWQKSTLLEFNGTNGDEPMSEVVFDGAGNLYGTTYGGGGKGNVDCFYETNGCGTAYELTPGNGTWTQTILHTFPATNFDGQNPRANLILDSTGNLYGTAQGGGGLGQGTVFQLSPSGSSWTENLIYSFRGKGDGADPLGGLLLASGSLLGTTNYLFGGEATVFQLTPGQGNWVFNLMYTFGQQDGYGPEASLTMDAAGNVYGTTVEGGAYGYGSVFELTPSNGGWTYTSLHDFTGGSDGSYIDSNLVMDADGNLYGVATNGGNDEPCLRGCGVVFEITPN